MQTAGLNPEMPVWGCQEQCVGGLPEVGLKRTWFELFKSRCWKVPVPPGVSCMCAHVLVPCFWPTGILWGSADVILMPAVFIKVSFVTKTLPLFHRGCRLPPCWWRSCEAPIRWILPSHPSLLGPKKTMATLLGSTRQSSHTTEYMLM